MLAHHPGIFILPLLGLMVGSCAIAYGIVGLATGEIPLTRSRPLKGCWAISAGIACILLGFGLIGLTVWSARFLPE
jgi:hypothetical protein